VCAVSLKQILVGQSFKRTLIRGLALAAALLVVSRTLVVPVRAVGISMLPTYADGQLLLFSALAYRVTEPVRGDIVMVTLETEDAVLVKRVIALPGERIQIVEGTVIVNDEPLREPYLHKKSAWNVGEVELGAGEYFVIGDNRSMSARNHTFGVVDRPSLLGRLMF
jgi:signal peptidase I